MNSIGFTTRWIVPNKLGGPWIIDTSNATVFFSSQKICDNLSRMDLDYDIVIKLLIIGDSGVGKSALMQRYSGEPFIEDSLSTIGVDFKILSRDIEVDGVKKKVKIQLWDTAGQERFKSITETYFRGAHGIVMVFDLTNEISFHNLKDWHESILLNSEIDADHLEIPLLMVGNKKDLKHKILVTDEDAKKMARDLRIPAYVKTSAKENSNVEKMFEKMIYQTVESQNYISNDRKEDIIVRNPIRTKKRDRYGDRYVDERKKNWIASLCNIL